MVLRSRVQTGGASSSAHFAVYDFIPQIIHSHPLLGLGLNTFSVYYEFVTGKTNWGPHSFWVALVVETGLVGLLLFCVFLRYVYLRLRAARLLGPALDAASMRGVLRPLAMGDDRGTHRHDRREFLLPDDVVLLLLRVRRARAGFTCGLHKGGKIRSRRRHLSSSIGRTSDIARRGS